jgi:hypothetical protein
MPAVSPFANLEMYYQPLSTHNLHYVSPHSHGDRQHCYSPVSQLPADVLVMILEYLEDNPTWLRQLRLVSKYYNIFVEAILYKTVDWDQDGGPKEELTKYLVSRIRNKFDHLSKRVREMKVTAIRNRPNGLNVEDLKSVVLAIEDLRYFQYVSYRMEHGAILMTKFSI